MRCVAGSHSVATASGMAEQWPELADETPVTATVGNGGLTPSDSGAMEEWLALMPSYGGRVSGRAVCPFRRGVASSEAETFCSLEGRLATLELGGGAGRGRGLPAKTLDSAPRLRLARG